MIRARPSVPHPEKSGDHQTHDPEDLLPVPASGNAHGSGVVESQGEANCPSDDLMRRSGREGFHRRAFGRAVGDEDADQQGPEDAGPLGQAALSPSWLKILCLSSSPASRPVGSKAANAAGAGNSIDI